MKNFQIAEDQISSRVPFKTSNVEVKSEEHALWIIANIVKKRKGNFYKIVDKLANQREVQVKIKKELDHDYHSSQVTKENSPRNNKHIRIAYGDSSCSTLQKP